LNHPPHAGGRREDACCAIAVKLRTTRLATLSKV
jgi:hypothetical protein